MTHAVVFLLDVDNTLLDNDRVVEDLRGHLVQAIGSPSADRYWTLFERLRIELGYADYLGALQRYRVETINHAAPDPVLLQLSSYLIDYPFADRLYPGALRELVFTKIPFIMSSSCTNGVAAHEDNHTGTQRRVYRDGGFDWTAG